MLAVDDMNDSVQQGAIPGRAAFPIIIVRIAAARDYNNAMTQRIRIGLIGAGANTRLRHIPGLRAVENVEIVAVCNRRPESTQAAMREFNIPKSFAQWEQLVADPDLDAVVIGT